MGNQTIFRLQKLTPRQVQHSVQHALREIFCPDADPERKQLNQQMGAKTYKEFREQLKAKLKGVRIFREDSPPVIEAFISASPDFFKKNNRAQQEQYFRDSMQYMREKFGAENILLGTIHLDETTPHMSVFFVPLTVNPEVAEWEAEQAGRPLPALPEGRNRRRKQPFKERPPEIALSAKAFINGPRSLSAMQTEFWEFAGKPAWLDRGMEKSKARHIKVNDWKQAMAWLEDGMKLPEFEVPKFSTKEKITPKQIEDQVRAAYEKQFGSVIAAVKTLRADATLQQKKNAETSKRLAGVERQLENQKAAIEYQISSMEKEIKERVDEGVFKVSSAALASVKDDLAELEQRRAADAVPVIAVRDPVPAMKAQLNSTMSDRTVLMRALAKTIKQIHTKEAMEMLADEMSVPAGKGDIFDRLVKSGQAASFEAAVMQVARHINSGTEGGGRNAVAVASELEFAFK